MAEPVLRKAFDDVKKEGQVAKEKRKAHFEKIAAYDVKYKADAAARREKAGTETAKPA